jgi:hypothetical protein
VTARDGVLTVDGVAFNVREYEVRDGVHVGLIRSASRSIVAHSARVPRVGMPRITRKRRPAGGCLTAFGTVAAAWALVFVLAWLLGRAIGTLAGMQ